MPAFVMFDGDIFNVEKIILAQVKKNDVLIDTVDDQIGTTVTSTYSFASNGKALAAVKDLYSQLPKPVIN